MTRARYSQIDLSETTFYHVINRCVRRSFLCGEDRYSHKNYDHRRQWLIDRIKLLSQVFAIDIAAYAIMSNHYHLVLHVDQHRAKNWSQEEVIQRWLMLFGEHPLVTDYLDKQETEQEFDAKSSQKTDYSGNAKPTAAIVIIEKWRSRLYDISWFMRCLNQFIARAANKEDDCTGKFWEGRFKSQALLDEQALLSCMAYVDLNPIRAGVSHSLAGSDFTSIQERIKQHNAYQRHIDKPILDISVPQQPRALLPFAGIGNTNKIPFNLTDYLALTQWSGRHIDPNKADYIDVAEPQILEELGIDQETWLEAIINFRRQYGSFAGSDKILRSHAHSHGCSWHKGIN
ncbi:MAG: transposase [Gammaproteobacteria bacterium]|nr:transposase [Gammaproteobacteria bacterium]